MKKRSIVRYDGHTCLIHKKRFAALALMNDLKFPICITNFKTYESATGARALELAKFHEQVAAELGVNFAVCPQVTDIWNLAENLKIPVLAQHFDLVTYGAFTGQILPEALKAAGASGSLLNHAERRIPFSQIADFINRAREVGLFTVVCARDLKEAKEIAALNPDAVALEPPELIGGDVSVSTANPDIIKNAVREIPNVPVIVGAGVKTGQDVKIALALGARGILVASGVTRAASPRKVLEEFAKAML